ncbi:MAG: DivIVA domain-containing protein [Spirochaetales bacterium]
MQDFNIEKKGYNRDEVQNTIENLVADYESKISLQDAQIENLKQELDELNRALNEYKSKDKNISGTILAAVETAQQIENNSKNIYDSEIKKIKALYGKWEEFLTQAVRNYPEIDETYDIQIILQNFKNIIDRTIAENLDSMRVMRKENNKKAQSGIQSLLDRMNKTASKSPLGSSKTSGQSASESFNNNYIKKTSVEPQISVQSNVVKKARPDSSYVADSKPITNFSTNIKPITNLTLNGDDKYDNLADKYLNTNNTESENFAQNAYSRQLIAKNKKKQKEYEAYPEPNESGFDLKAALNPTEELTELMKSFDFFSEGDDK